jgi:hypothetical protein
MVREDLLQEVMNRSFLSKGGEKSILGKGSSLCKGPGVAGQHDKEAVVAGEDKVRQKLCLQVRAAERL